MPLTWRLRSISWGRIMGEVFAEWLVCLIAAACMWFVLGWFNGWLPLFFGPAWGG